MLPGFEQARELFAGYEITLTPELYEKLEIYADFLVSYNEKVNLTAITDGGEILRKHFLDSMLLLSPALFPEGAKVLDIGSGAGFPGVPMQLLRPDLDLTLLDSLQKRITFLDLLREKLSLRYATVHGRAEQLAKDPAFREQFDVVTARAVAALPVLAEYSLPYVKVGGCWIAMKGPNEPLRPALQAIRMLGGHAEEPQMYELPGGDARMKYVVKKIASTPTKYPRNSGQIKQKPL